MIALFTRVKLRLRGVKRFAQGHRWETVKPGFQCTDVEEARAGKSLGTLCVKGCPPPLARVSLSLVPRLCASEEPALQPNFVL